MGHELEEIQHSFEKYNREWHTQPKGVESVAITNFLKIIRPAFKWKCAE